MEDDGREFREDVERLNGNLRPDLRFAVVADGTVTGVLVVEFAGGRRRRADHPVLIAGERRRRLHSLAASLAECAMSLGLGTGIYRRGALPASSCRRPASR